MERRAETKTIRELRSEYPRIDFPDYQREPSVWSREQKQKLLDSILRKFDIAALYFYERDTDGVWECIDGRQRISAVMSFVSATDEADPDRGFPLRIEN